MSYTRGKLAVVLLAVAVAASGVVLAVCRGGDPPRAEPVSRDVPATSPAIQLRPHDAGGPTTVQLEPDEREATVIYCGVTHGAIEACGCNGNPTGGMTKELTVVERLRGRGVPSLYLNPGDLFPYEKRPAKMKYIAQAAALMGYDAMCIGEQELIEGLPLFRQLAAEHRLPYLSENLRDPEGKRVAPGYMIRDLGGVKVGIFAVFGSESYLYLDEKFMAKVKIEPAFQAVDTVLGALEGRVDFLIMLSHQDKYLDRQVAHRFPQINLIIGGHDEELIATPIRVGHTLILNAGIVSEQIGVVRLAIDPARHVRILGHEFVATPAPIPKHPKIEKVYKDYVTNSKIKPEENDEQLPQTFQPAETCEPCHKEIYKQFMTSKHARAWKTLVDAGRAKHSECWYCHTSGTGRAGGFRSIEETPELADVSCQACHLVTHDHADRGIKDDLDYCQDEKTCQQCHTLVTSPNWNFWEYSEKNDHHLVKEKSNDPPADYKHWRVKPVRKLPDLLKEKAAGDKAATPGATSTRPAGRSPK